MAISYTLKTSTRARRLRLAVHADGRVVVTAPALMSRSFVDSFVEQRSGWVADALARFRRRAPKTIIEAGPNAFAKYKSQARSLVLARLNHFNAFYNFRFKKVFIKNQKARWASCSKKGNLNFSFKIALLPADLADYIIVHELCHPFSDEPLKSLLGAGRPHSAPLAHPPPSAPLHPHPLAPTTTYQQTGVC